MGWGGDAGKCVWSLQTRYCKRSCLVPFHLMYPHPNSIHGILDTERGLIHFTQQSRRSHSIRLNDLEMSPIFVQYLFCVDRGLLVLG